MSPRRYEASIWPGHTASTCRHAISASSALPARHAARARSVVSALSMGGGALERGATGMGLGSFVGKASIVRRKFGLQPLGVKSSEAILSRRTGIGKTRFFLIDSVKCLWNVTEQLWRIGRGHCGGV